MKNVLILSGSPRKGGNSDLLCDAFLAGALDAGHRAEKVRVAELSVAPCLGCYRCVKAKGVCVQNDDMAKLLRRIIEADVLVLASPVYFYSVCAQLKAVIDRTVARWQEIRDKEFYYITSSAEDSPTVADTTLACFRGFADCFEGSRECGVITAKGNEKRGDVKNKPELATAYAMGKNV